MPVRRVSKNSRSLTGLVPNTRTSSMTAFESSLERDFLLLLDFDPDVEFYEEQPVHIVYYDDTGRRRTYTPDVFVRYRPASSPTTSTKPLLCEVKYREDLRQHWTVYRPKFRAAQRYARQQGWRFRLVTERHVRTPYLENVKFLRPYRTLPVNDHHQSQLLDTLLGLREAAPATLLAAVSQDRWHQAQLLSTLWQLVATQQVHTDLGQPLTMRSRLWLKEPR
jgi:TnsA endonuclease N terminal/TnsA endonuclease C terminal